MAFLFSKRLMDLSSMICWIVIAVFSCKSKCTDPGSPSLNVFFGEAITIFIADWVKRSCAEKFYSINTRNGREGEQSSNTMALCMFESQHMFSPS